MLLFLESWASSVIDFLSNLLSADIAAALANTPTDCFRNLIFVNAAEVPAIATADCHDRAMIARI